MSSPVPALLFDRCAKALERIVPLSRNLRQIPAHVIDPFGLERPNPFSSAPLAAHDACVVQRVQMLCDRLSRYVSAVGEFGDR